MTDGQVRVARDAMRVTIVIDRAHKRNAFSPQIQDELASILDELSGDESIGLVVLTGAGSDNFTSGGDLVALSEIRTAEGATEMAAHARAVLDRIRRFPAPVVAALNGDALGGGAELAMACDFRVAAAHARIAFAQGRQAISSAWGGGVDLFRIVGPSAALRFLCTTEAVDHDLGRRVGLYDSVAGEGQSIESAVDDFIAPMLKQPPHVLRSFKALATASRMGGNRAELENIEITRFAENWVHDDHWTALDRFLSRVRR